jgi:uncharacterized protein YjeT (DUF2065 family)
MLVFEGLLLFVAPQAWQQMALKMIQTDPRQLRVGGGIAIALWLFSLQVVL